LRPPFLSAKFIRITWPFGVILVLMLAFSIACMEILAAARAYVGGEGLWSKAQKDAVAHLARYARTQDPGDYQRFRRALAMPLGDRVAREAMSREPFDRRAAEEGLIVGGNHPDDVGRMIWLFRTLGRLSFMREAIAIWTAGDALIEQLDRTGAEIDRRIRSGDANTPVMPLLLDEVDRINHELRPLEDAFSATLGTISRQVTTVLLLALSVLAGVFLAAATWISRSMLARTEQAEAALRASEAAMHAEQERAHVTLGSIHDGVISTDARGRVRYLNAAAAHITGWTREAALGAPLHGVFRLADAGGAEPVEPAVARLLGEGPIEAIRDAVLLRQDESRVAVDASLAPIRDRAGRVLGVVAAFRDVSQERELAQRLHHQATHDALTGLVNRREFENRLRVALAEASAAERQFTVLVIDLDQFKVVNDTSGHPAGDRLLCLVSERMAGTLRSGDTLARLGGDEFGVLLADCALAPALAVAEKLRQCIAGMRFAWRDRTHVVGASIGAATLDAGFRNEAEVLGAADSACYVAKESGRNRIKVYQPDDHLLRARTGELEWVTRLAAALEDDRFTLHAQEIRPVRGGPAEARFEVLLRLIDEAGGLVSPMAFIPAAERYGVMARLDLWVIDRVLQELAARQRAGLSLPVLAVNLSGASLADPGLLPAVRERLAATGVSADRLCFELTESAAVTHLGAAARLLRELRQLGCAIGLDDFGSGMSSFGYLRNLPLDFIKIDGHFVREMHIDPVDRAMAAAIHTVGHVMGLRTIAEWVEHEAVLEELAALGVDFAQGHAVARPVPLATALQRMDGGRGPRPEGRAPVRLVHTSGG
jgi:diguanylate cyclase (GGDEF)-like protein/PAS domain S-box-containing protein